MARSKGYDNDDERGTKRAVYAAFTANVAIAVSKPLRYL
jgi:hypothetical protein